MHSLQHTMREASEGEVPVRQNRRMPLIEAALKPARGQFSAETLETLSKALALVIGTEGMIVIKDVLQLDDSDARKVKHWAIRALIEAAITDARTKPSPEKQHHPSAARAAKSEARKSTKRAGPRGSSGGR
jgi:hypothetical protein